MPRASELLRQGRREELWQMCCGFLDLTIDEFMEIQERLLMRQIELLADCPLGKRLLHGNKPESMEEFRREVPITTYSDYVPELVEKREDALPAKPAQWIHSSGKTGEYAFKWIPISEEYAWELSLAAYGAGLISSAKFRGDTSGAPLHPKIIYAVAPRPYFSGALADILRRQTEIMYIPPIEEAEDMQFDERIQLGFNQSLDTGFDYFFGLSLVLTTIGDKFRQASTSIPLKPLLKKPRVLMRLMRAMIKSKLARRHIMPGDIWRVRGILCGGLDSFVYRDKIREQWGRYPLDLYIGSEGGIYAMQAWDYTTMTFLPNLNFLEFIPEEEQIKWQMDRSYQPETLLLDEVKAGEIYEIVITNFHGGAMVRYRPGDMIRITALRNEASGINLPQMVFERRADDIIDFVFVRLTEKLIWEAIEHTGIPYEDWIAYKKTGETTLHVLIEFREETNLTPEMVADSIYREVIQTDEHARTLIPDEYAHMINFSVVVTFLPRGIFQQYMEKRQLEGADLAHLKPAHINPPESILNFFIESTEEIIEVIKPLKGTATAGERMVKEQINNHTASRGVS